MQIRQVKIANFRGIRGLNWSVDGSIICLIGLGDSTKSTVLDAIDLALCSRFNPPISDTDFFNEDPNNPIEIEVSVGQLPMSFLREDKFGLLLRGWRSGTGLQEEPADQDEPILSIRFHVDATLEPTWTVINQRLTEGRTISVKDRETLGVVRLGTDIDRHFAWSRGSALSRITTGNVNPNSVLAEASRVARQQLGQADTTVLRDAAAKTQRAAERFGVKPRESFQPALDTRATPSGMGALSIYEGGVPIRMRGLGSRRLIALALQTLSVKDGAIALVDEIETGLEPHRIRDIIRKIQQASERQPGSDDLSIGQAFMTTHSPTAIRSLSVGQLRVVRSTDGNSEVLRLNNDLQGTVRACPEAFLAKKIIVCEGKTELGMVWGLEDAWSQSREGLSLSYLGAVPIDGGGSSAARHAMNLKFLRYEVALFIDSDTDPTPSIQELTEQGITVVRWGDRACTEKRLSLDLPWEHFKRCVQLAMEIKSPESVRDAIFLGLEQNSSDAGFDPDQWIASGIENERLRRVFAVASVRDSNRWFKQVEAGQKLGQVIGEAIPQIQESDLARRLRELETWIYAGTS
jgi:hypothetical protein